MRIALVNTTRGWGGAEEQMLVLARELAKRGEAITVVARRGSPVMARFEAAGQRVLAVTRKGAGAVFAPFAAAAEARAQGFDIIHSHRDHDLPLGKLLALCCGAPLVLTQHCRPNKPYAPAYGLADRLVAVSSYIACGITQKLPGLSGRFEVIVNGIDLELFSGADSGYWCAHPEAGRRGPLIGVVGAFYKGQEELVAALPSLLEEFPRLALILIGEDASRRDKLQELARHKGVAEAVVFAGRIPREQMKHALAGLDLNASAFCNEGFGLSVVEGLAVGTPFVGYKTGGYPEIVTTVAAGRLVEPGQGLEEAIAALLRERQPREETAEACRQVAEEFSLCRMVDAYQKLYQSLKERA